MSCKHEDVTVQDYKEMDSLNETIKKEGWKLASMWNCTSCFVIHVLNHDNQKCYSFNDIKKNHH